MMPLPLPGSEPAFTPVVSGAGEAERARLLYEQLVQAAVRHDSVEPLAQDISTIIAGALGDVCCIVILGLDDQSMHVAGLHDRDPRALALLKEAQRAGLRLPQEHSPAAQTILRGEPLLWTAVPAEWAGAVAVTELGRHADVAGLDSLMAVPLRGRDGVFGAITLGRRRGGAPYGEADLELLEGMASRLSISLGNLLLLGSLRSQMEAASAAREALAASEQRFRSIFESAALGVEVMDPLGTVIDSNPAFEAMTGYGRAELTGKFFAALVHPADAAALAHVFTGVRLNRPAEGPLEHRVLRKDGSVVWLRTSFTGVRSATGGEAVGMIVALHENITGRVRTEQYFQAMLEAMPDALVMTDAQGRITLLNRQAEKMFGYSRQELLGMPVEALVPERFREGHPAQRQSYLEDPAIRPMGHARDLFAVRRDGSQVPVEVRLSYLEMDGGPVVMAAVRDVSERKKEEAALVRSRRSLAEAQRVASLGSLEYDLLTGLLEPSEEALHILGITGAQLGSAADFEGMIHADDAAAVRAHVSSVLQAHEPEEFEFRIRHPDGQTHILHDRVVGYFSPEGKPTRLLATFQDVTARRQAEREMAELKQRMQDSVELERLRLAQDLHDGPMQDLYGVVFRLDELQRAPDAQEAATLRALGEQVQHTIGELRDMARELRPPSISALGLEKSIRSYAQDFREKHPTITLELSLAQDQQLLPEEVRLTLFRVLQQALANVLRHSEADTVRILFSLDAEEARLSVADNGKGFHVPPNWIGFVRGGHYGLAGAAERLNALGGRLQVESEPGRQTVITASVPWMRPADPPGEAGRAQ